MSKKTCTRCNQFYVGDNIKVGYSDYIISDKDPGYYCWMVKDQRGTYGVFCDSITSVKRESAQPDKILAETSKLFRKFNFEK